MRVRVYEVWRNGKGEVSRSEYRFDCEDWQEAETAILSSSVELAIPDGWYRDNGIMLPVFYPLPLGE